MNDSTLRARSRHSILFLWIVAAGLAWPTGAVKGQSDTLEIPSPVTVADEFNRGFQSMAWPGLVQRIHPRGLADLRLAADILVAADSSGYVLDVLLGGVDAGSYAALPDDEVVRRLLSGIQSEVPGLLSSLVSRRTETLGSVPEGERRHVVYRIQAQVSGSVPEIRVMTLERFEGRWRVVEAEDLRVLHTAIRGIPVPRSDPRAASGSGLGGHRVPVALELGLDLLHGAEGVPVQA